MLEGSYTAIVTPFKDGIIDEYAFKKLIDRQIEAGITGIVPCGTTGESPTLSHDEHKKVVEMTVNYVAKRVKVIAGAGSNSTREAIELTKHAKNVGADAALIITPYYNKPTQKGLYLHFKAIAETVDIPIVMYNVPGRTGVNISLETICELAKLENIVAIKEASCSVEKVSEIVSKTNIEVLSGEDALTYPIICVGGKGVISVTSNIIPDIVADMVKAALKGEFEKASKIHKRIFNLNKKVFIETNPIPVKAALSAMGLICEEYRLPLCKMSDENKQILIKELNELGIIK